MLYTSSLDCEDLTRLEKAFLILSSLELKELHVHLTRRCE